MSRKLWSVLFFFAGRAFAAGPEPYTLEGSLRLAQRNDAELQSAEQDITIARQRVREAFFLFYPEVGLQATATRYEARRPFALRPGFGSSLLFPSDKDHLYSGQAYLNLSLYEGRRHINTLRLAQTLLKQAQSKYDAVRLDIGYNTKRVFYRFILAKKILEAAEEFSAKFKSHDVSRLSAAERIEAESAAAELRAALSEAHHTLELARLDFLKGLNRELDTSAELSGNLQTTPVEVDIKKALLWATELRPELQSQTYRSQMDAISVNLALGRRNPTLILGVDYDVTGQDFPLRQNNWDATVGLKIPFAFDYWTQHTQRLAEQRQGEIIRSELHDRVQLEVRKAHNDLTYWQGEYPQREREYHALERSLTAISPNSPGALRSAVRVLHAHRLYLEAVTEHVLARSRLERAMAHPLPER